VNSIFLCGRLGGDPEKIETKTGTAMCRFSMATSSQKDETDWHRVVAFGRSAEIAMEYLSKGTQVIVQGSLRYGVWSDKDGNERKYSEIRANRIELLGKKESAPVTVERTSASVAKQATDSVDLPF
jgi:single-strand DNA-binding protein